VIDLKSHDDVVSDNLSNDNSTSLVKSSLRSQKVSSQSNVGDVNGSRSDNVDDDSSVGDGEEISRESDISVSSDVHNPVSLEVAVLGNVVSRLSENLGGDREDVLIGSVGSAGKEQSSPLDSNIDVVGLGSEGGRVSSVARLSSGEDRIEASGGRARAKSVSGPEISGSGEGSSAESILSSSGVRSESSVGVKRSRNPVAVSSSDERSGNRSVGQVVVGAELISDRVSLSGNEVSLNADSSLNISSVSSEVVERNKVAVSEREGGRRVRWESDVQSSAVGLKSGAKLGGGRGVDGGSRGLAVNSVDLSRVLNVSVDLESLNVSSVDGVHDIVGGQNVSSNRSSADSD